MADWPDVMPYSDEPEDRWLRLRWAAKRFGIDYKVLLEWAKTGHVAAREVADGRWLVSERDLTATLFGEEPEP